MLLRRQTGVTPVNCLPRFGARQPLSPGGTARPSRKGVFA